jgi:hypothetical protein
MYSSQERYDEVIGEQLKDLKEIEDLLYPGGSPEQDAPGGVKAFPFRHAKAMGRNGEVWSKAR